MHVDAMIAESVEDWRVDARAHHFSRRGIDQLDELGGDFLRSTSKELVSRCQHGQSADEPAVTKGALFDLVRRGIAFDELGNFPCFVRLEVLTRAEPFTLSWVWVALRLHTIAIH